MGERDIKILPDWELRIKKTSNGFILSYLEEYEDNIYRVEREVFENDCDKEFICNWDELDKQDINPEDIAMHNMLNAVKEYFGTCYNKHEKVNLVVKFEKNE